MLVFSSPFYKLGSVVSEYVQLDTWAIKTCSFLYELQFLAYAYSPWKQKQHHKVYVYRDLAREFTVTLPRASPAKNREKITPELW